MAVICVGVRVSQMGAMHTRWGGGPSLESGEVRGSGTAGRSSGVRPVLEPVLARRSVEGVGEKSRSGRGAEGAGEAVFERGAGSAVVVLILGKAVADVVVEDMALRKARKGARGGQSRGGATRTVKGGWSATRDSHTKGGARGTVIIYRNLPLGCEGPYIGIWSLSANITFIQGVMGLYCCWRGGDNYVV